MISISHIIYLKNGEPNNSYQQNTRVFYQTEVAGIKGADDVRSNTVPEKLVNMPLFIFYHHLEKIHSYDFYLPQIWHWGNQQLKNMKSTNSTSAGKFKKQILLFICGVNSFRCIRPQLINSCDHQAYHMYITISINYMISLSAAFRLSSI